ncbi:Cupredoxin [Macrolepiota fuliginosa MF-IS2]|uniref:Cupredoxin n=1 Tax=Macrolepiota fuliginosa MF-IS2 TaxID=1400762 RepID=A0A9P6C5X3_9AGAR|nr:Cupredoxin [Macrolepiota fuliginosa MF-IS2]
MRVLFVLASLSALVYAANILVMVGKDGGLTYDPASVTAKKGDTVAFRFLSKNHTVTQSSFAKPCQPLATGVDSGYAPVPANSTAFPEWSFTVNNDSAPFWFYCAQARHCQAGMVFALNPTANKTFNMFKANAMGASGSSNTSTTSAPPLAGATPPSTVGSPNTATGITASGTAAGSLNPQANGAPSTRSMSSVVVVVAVVGLVSGLSM